MDELKCFFIDGRKKIIIRREEDFFICFDPMALEFYEINEEGACILFLISEKQKYGTIIDILQDWFEMEKREVKEYVDQFIESLPIKALILANLIELGVPNECLII